MLVAQLLFPFTTCAPPRTIGDARATSGHCATNSLASASDSVTALPVPSRTPDQLKTHEYLLDFNPFFTLLQIVRGPMLGELPSFAVYISALTYSGLVFLASWLVFSRVRGRIAFWV